MVVIASVSIVLSSFQGDGPPGRGLQIYVDNIVELREEFERAGVPSLGEILDQTWSANTAPGPRAGTGPPPSPAAAVRCGRGAAPGTACSARARRPGMGGPMDPPRYIKRTRPLYMSLCHAATVRVARLKVRTRIGEIGFDE